MSNVNTVVSPGMSSSEGASLAALALVVGFQACEGGFFKAGLVLGGGILIQWIDSRLGYCSDLKVACYWKHSYRTDLQRWNLKLCQERRGEWIILE